MLDDLASIRESLMLAQTEGQNPEPNPLLDLELAGELKSVVDVLRELLWTYITALSAQSGRRPREVLEWYKMELAVGMLRKVNSQAPLPVENMECSSSFEQLVTHALTVTAMHTGQERRM